MWKSIDPGVRQVLDDALENEAFPGCVAVYGDGQELFGAALGHMDYSREVPVEPATIYDLASLTKVLMTTLLALEAVQDGALGLNQMVKEVLPEFHDGVTFRHLLLHNSGLPAHRLYPEIAESAQEAKELILREPLIRAPGTETEYSCIGFLVLYFALEALGYSSPRTWAKLGAEFTFSPEPRAAPTELLMNNGSTLVLQGWVHDENARFLGGRAGNAGLFGDAATVARLAQFWLREGEGEIPHQQVKEWRSKATDRALGWDIKSETGSSAGSMFGPQSFGHTGFTGTSLLVDPEARIFAVLLTNRVHPSRDNLKIKDVRPRFHDAVFSAMVKRR